MLISILVIVLILALALYAVQLLPIDGRLTLLLQLLIILIAIFYLAGFV